LGQLAASAGTPVPEASDEGGGAPLATLPNNWCYAHFLKTPGLNRAALVANDYASQISSSNWHAGADKGDNKNDSEPQPSVGRIRQK